MVRNGPRTIGSVAQCLRQRSEREGRNLVSPERELRRPDTSAAIRRNGLALKIGPAVRRCDGRDINVIAPRFGREGNRQIKVAVVSPGADLAAHRNPCAFQDEQIRFRIEKLPAQRKRLRLPDLARRILHDNMSRAPMSSAFELNIAVFGAPH